MKYFFYDTETGGLDETKVSILSLSCIVANEELNVVDELDFFIKPTDGVYRVQANAMKVNKIDLVEHDLKAVTDCFVIRDLCEYFHMTNTALPITVVTHNGDLDRRFLKQMLNNNGYEYDNFFFKRSIDTCATGMLLKNVGIIPADNDCSLVQLFNHFYPNEAETLKVAHSAKTDTRMTLAVFKAMRQLLKDIYSNSKERHT